MELEHLHPAVVHFPIAFLLAAAIFDLIAVIGRHREFHAGSMTLLILGTLAAAVAVITGNIAETETVEIAGLSPYVHSHETYGLVTLIVSGLVTLIRVGLHVSRRVHGLMAGLALLLSVGCAALGLATGYLGGGITHEHGPELRERMRQLESGETQDEDDGGEASESSAGHANH